MITKFCADRAARRGSFDLSSDFATPLPITLITKLLGIPDLDVDRFAASARWWTNRSMAGSRCGRTGTSAGPTTTSLRCSPHTATPPLALHADQGKLLCNDPAQVVVEEETLRWDPLAQITVRVPHESVELAGRTLRSWPGGPCAGALR